MNMLISQKLKMLRTRNQGPGIYYTKHFRVVYPCMNTPEVANVLEYNYFHPIFAEVIVVQLFLCILHDSVHRVMFPVDDHISIKSVMASRNSSTDDKRESQSRRERERSKRLSETTQQREIRLQRDAYRRRRDAETGEDRERRRSLTHQPIYLHTAKNYNQAAV